MRKSVAVLLMFIILLTGAMPVFADNTPNIASEAAVLIDVSNGRVLFDKNADKVMYPASTTKIMTALLALEAVDRGEITLDTVLTYSESADATMAIDGSGIALKVGEQMTLKNLLEGLMIASGNDAAACIAEGVSGTIDAFVAKMNQRALELGLKNTHFVNPCGLQDKEHYTTANELAKLATVAMKNTTFRSIVECAHIYLPETNMSEKRYYINTNNLVSRMRYPYYFYEKATGIKTGSTNDAGHCLVSSAEDKGKSVIAVVLKAGGVSDSHTDSKALLEYGLKSYAITGIVAKDESVREVRVKQASDGTDHIVVAAKESLEESICKEISLVLKCLSDRIIKR